MAADGSTDGAARLGAAEEMGMSDVSESRGNFLYLGRNGAAFT